MAKVLCVGVNPAFDITLTLDGLDDDRVNHVLSEYRQAAGKAANVACVLAEEGVSAALTGFFGEETWAEWRALYSRRTDRVELLPVMIKGSTRQNITLLAEGRTVKINRTGDPTEASAIDRLNELMCSWLTEGDVAVFSGSMPQGISSEQYFALINTAGEAGARTVVDCDFITEDELLTVHPWLYKPNAHELAKLCGIDPDNEAELIAQAERLAKYGVDTVLLTMGSRGLALVTPQRTIRVAAEQVNAVNTVGAGDAALAAYIAAVLNGRTPEECAKLAALAGARAAASVY